MSDGLDLPDSKIESSKSSLVFVQLLLLALPILTAPVIFTSGNIGEDYGIDLLILAVIGGEFIALAVYGWRKSDDYGKSTDAGQSKSIEEVELQCPNCQGTFPYFVSLPSNETSFTEKCTFCGEESSIVLN